MEKLLKKVYLSFDSITNTTGAIFTEGNLDVSCSIIDSEDGMRVIVLVQETQDGKLALSARLDNYSLMMEDSQGKRYSSTITNGLAILNDIPYDALGRILHHPDQRDDITELVSRYISVWKIVNGSWDPRREDFASEQVNIFWDRTSTGVLELYVYTYPGAFCNFENKQLVLTDGTQEHAVDFERQSSNKWIARFLPPLDGEFELQIKESLPES